MKKLFTIITLLLFSFMLISCQNKLSNLFDEVSITFDTNDNLNHVTKDITLTNKLSNNKAVITWESDNPNTIKIEGNKGLVTRGVGDEVVKLTATITLNNKSESKNFVLIVIKAPEVVPNTFDITILNPAITSNLDELSNVLEGSKVMFTVTIPEGYELSEFLVNDIEEELTNNQFVIDSLDKDITVDVIFSEIAVESFKITILNDSIKSNLENLDEVPLGTKVTFTITIPEGYEVSKFLVNEIEQELTNNKFVIDSLDKDITVDVSFEEKKILYTVTFNPNNGDDIYEELIKDGLKVSKPLDPIRDNYKFVGWYLDDLLFDFNTPITSDIKLVAMWQQLFLQVIEKFDFGTVNKSGYDTTSFTFTNTEGSTHTLIKQRAQINSSTSSPHDTQGQMLVMGPVSDKVDGISFVEFDFSGTQNLSKIEFQFAAWNNAALTRITGFTNAVFYLQVLNNGTWNTLKDSNNIENLLTYLESGNHIYNWVSFNNLEPAKYRLYYNTPSANTSNTGQALVVDDLSVYGLFDVVDGNLVTFDYNYEGGPSNFINIVEEGELVTEPTEPNRLGYDFLGWYLGDNEFLFNTPITSNITLTAKWRQSKLVITFDFGSSDLSPHIELIELNEKVIEISEPQREGYLFVGWYQTEVGKTFNSEFNFNQTLDSNIRLYAKWEIIEKEPLVRDDDLLDEYYESIVGLTDEDLVFELRTILIQTHSSPTNYGEARYILDKTDKTLYDHDLVYGIYYREAIKGTWDGVSWTREHVWPNSKLGVSRVDNSDTNQASDLHNLRAINQNVNSSRGNRYFTNTTNNYPIGHTIGSYGYYPGDEDIGDVARILLYMAVRYDLLKLTNHESLLLLGDNTNNNFVPETAYMGMLDVLYNWHLMDPVDEFEIMRNEIIYQNQGNRNPFIDHPELFEEVFNYYVLLDEERVIPNSLLAVKEVNIYKVDINYYEFRNRREYII